MDPQRAIMNGGGIYYSDMWPGFPMNANANANSNATAYGSESLDSMRMYHRSDHSPANLNSRKRRKEDDCARGASISSYNCNDNEVTKENEMKRPKAEGSNENYDNKEDEEGNFGKDVEQPSKQAEQPKQDYIHVRARRGQATDSHSLAERARREKISERMKILQDLVPGCNKVIGKALVLDEIINYIQSLQHQVEFLSMKLEAVNTRVGSINAYPSKDFGQQTFDALGMSFGSQATKEYGRSSSPEWLHMQIGGGFERTS